MNEQERQHDRMEAEQEQQQQYDDLTELGLFHKSSLHSKEQIPLQRKTQQTFNVKRTVGENNQTKINDYVEIGHIGRGAFAEVKRVRKQSNHEEFAMKIYNLLKLKSKKFCAADGSFADSQQMLRNEIEIISCLNHANLASCHQIMYGSNYAFFIMQLCDLGQIMDWSEEKNNFVRNKNVFDYLSAKYKTNKLEDVTRIIFLQVSLGLQYLHKNNISNRDIKVENILCKKTQLNGQDIKISDFTTVRYSKDDISFFTCGTAGFRGPQMQNASSDGYSCKALDIWSMGISMYTYLFQNFPFMAETDYIIEMKAEKEQLVFNEQCPTWMKDLIQRMTKKNWKQRIQINQIIQILRTK